MKARRSTHISGEKRIRNNIRHHIKRHCRNIMKQIATKFEHYKIKIKHTRMQQKYYGTSVLMILSPPTLARLPTKNNIDITHIYILYQLIWKNYESKRTQPY